MNHLKPHSIFITFHCVLGEEDISIYQIRFATMSVSGASQHLLVIPLFRRLGWEFHELSVFLAYISDFLRTNNNNTNKDWGCSSGTAWFLCLGMGTECIAFTTHWHIHLLSSSSPQPPFSSFFHSLSILSSYILLCLFMWPFSYVYVFS